LFIFFACPKKTNQKKGQPFTWFRDAELPCAAQNNRALAELASLRQSSRYSGYFSAARLREMAKTEKSN
jgi:hypothetical protein